MNAKMQNIKKGFLNETPDWWKRDWKENDQFCWDETLDELS